MCLKLRGKFRFLVFLRVFGTFAYKIAEIMCHSHMLEIMCQVTILRVLSVFGTFKPKVAQTLVVLRETWHITLFGIY